MDKNLALETLKSFVENTDNVIAKDAILALHPELAESEDERIRKEIINYLNFAESHNLLRATDYGKKEGWNAYLERQKKQKPLSTKETELNSIAFLEQMGYTCIPPGKEQPVEWSEEDEIYLQDALWCVKQASKVAKGENDMGACWSAERWLKSLRPQPKQEWSEEFLRLMGITISQDGNQVCVLLGENLAEGIAGFGDTLADAVEEFKKEWRQFDRLRKTIWKPSEEQMEELLNALTPGKELDCDILAELYGQLKKL